MHYKGTFNDGKQFDSSYDRGEPLEFTCGAGQMIKGFDAAVADMELGAEVDIHLLPAEAYGEVDPNAIFTMPVLVTDVTATMITFDANHEMAGKELNFHIKLVEVK